MKKILLIPVLFLLACHSQVAENTERQAVALEKIAASDTNPINIDNEVSIIVIDSCEYIRFEAYNKGSICHKGNCKFCKDRLK